ncbi:MAG: CDP-diacylglycerol--glycerol-3-phosphate 3-phosphatidyltransferase, partial [uncultured Gemmatimonadetes bacterium]
GLAQPSERDHAGAHRPCAGGGAHDRDRRLLVAARRLHRVPGGRLLRPVGRPPGALAQPGERLRQADGPAGRQAAAGPDLHPVLPAVARVGAAHPVSLVRRRAASVGARRDLRPRDLHHHLPRLRGQARRDPGGGQGGKAQGGVPEHLRGRGHLLVRPAVGRARERVGHRLLELLAEVPRRVHHGFAGHRGGADGVLAVRVPARLRHPGPQAGRVV